MPQYLKTTEKISYNMASDASYFYNLRGQKFIKNAKNVPEACDQRVLPDRLILIGQKLLKIAKKYKWDIVGNFAGFCIFLGGLIQAQNGQTHVPCQ